MTTASQVIGELCDVLRIDPRVRLIDATNERPTEHTGIDLAQRIERAKGSLAASGVTSNDTVLFAVRPSITAVVFLQALIALGIRTALIDLRDPEDLVRSKIDQVKPDMVLVEPISAVSSLRPVRSLLELIGRPVPSIRTFAPRLVTTRQRRGSRPSNRDPHPNDDALIVFTSGTMSDPKAVVHTQGTLGAIFSSMISLAGDASEEIMYTDQFHSLLPTLAAGAAVVFGSPGAPPPTILERLRHHQATTWFTTPPAAAQVMSQLNDVSALKHIVVGSAPVTGEFASDMQRAAPHIQLTAIYAMTEVAPIAVADGRDISAYRHQGDLVGKPLSNLDIAIDSSGEVLVDGPSVGRYLGVDKDLVHTGDLGHLTPQGDLVLDGRSKDMILVGARNIYPQHHESSLAQTQGISEVVLVGRRDTYGDEQLWLLVDAEPGRDQNTLVDAIVGSAHGATLPIHGILFGSIPRSGRSHKTDRIASQRAVDQAVTLGTGHTLSWRD